MVHKYMHGQICLHVMNINKYLNKTYHKNKTVAS